MLLGSKTGQVVVNKYLNERRKSETQPCANTTFIARKSERKFILVSHNECCTATPLCGGKIHRPASQSFMSFTKLPYNEAIDLISFLSACWLSRKAGAWTVGPAADNMPINEIRFPASCFRVREQALVHRPQRGNFVNRLVICHFIKSHLRKLPD